MAIYYVQGSVRAYGGNGLYRAYSSWILGY